MEMKWVSSDEFEKRMDENPNAVYVVETYLDNGNRSETGIFSTKRKAEDWCYEPINDERTCVVAPYVIDEPDFGNKING